jgi:hypothetical protein
MLMLLPEALTVALCVFIPLCATEIAFGVALEPDPETLIVAELAPDPELL